MSLLKELKDFKKRYLKRMKEIVYSTDHPDYDLYFDQEGCKDNFIYLENELKRLEKELKQVQKYLKKK